jgi:hypothetical protein
MARRKNWSAEQIVAKLRQIEIQMAHGKSLRWPAKKLRSRSRAPGRVPEAGDLLQLTRGAGRDRTWRGPLQSRPAPLLLGLPAPAPVTLQATCDQLPTPAAMQ